MLLVATKNRTLHTFTRLQGIPNTVRKELEHAVAGGTNGMVATMTSWDKLPRCQFARTCEVFLKVGLLVLTASKTELN